MPRGPRIDAPGCLQHVLLRGNERREIFQDDADRQDLKRRLSRVLLEAGMPCFAWAFMPNHVHLVLRTGDTPLARVMARVGTGYAMAFNRRHGRVGHLFQNRYKSILVDDDSHFLVLVRYVHLNPVRGGVVPSVDALARYPWTGHATLVGRDAAPFQATAAVLDRFGASRTAARQRLLEWMGSDSESPDGVFEAEEPRSAPPDRRATARRRPRRSREAAFASLVAGICARRGVARSDLLSGSSRARSVTKAREELIYRAVAEVGIAAAEVARQLGISPGSVSRARRRGQARPASATEPPTDPHGK